MTERPTAGQLAISALVLAASDLALLAIAVSPAVPPAPPELRMAAVVRAMIDHVKS